MKLKINISVILGFALCVALVCGIWALGGKDSSTEAWSPNQMYGSLGEGPTKISRVRYASGSVSSGSDVLVPMSSGSRRMASASRRYVAAPVAGSSAPSMSFGANGPSPISYTASSAGYHSFGGGGGNGGASGAGLMRSSSPVSQGSLSVAVSSPSYAQASVVVPNMVQSSPAEAEVFAAMSYSGHSNQYWNMSSYISTMPYQGGSLSSINAGNMGISSKRNGGVQDAWIAWLFNYLGCEQGGTYNLDYYDLQEAYIAYVQQFVDSSWDPWSSTEEGYWAGFDTWLAWLQSEDSSYRGTEFNWVPVGDYYPLLILALLYAGVMLIRRRKQQISENNI